MDGNFLMKRDKEMDKKNKLELFFQFFYIICFVCFVIISYYFFFQIFQIKKVEFFYIVLVYNILNRQGDIMWLYRVKIGRYIFFSKFENF